MPQYKRVGHDFTMEMDNPNPEYWELVPEEKSAKSTKVTEPEESDA